MGYGELLRIIGSAGMGELYFGIFIFYIGFCLVGLLNVVTGIFVDSAVCTRTEDEIVASWEEDLKRTQIEVQRIFEDADTDGSGALSYDELQIHLEHPGVKAFFASIDIDPSEARTIFSLVDVDGDKQVKFDQFLNGTIKLKGYAKSMDVISIMYDHARHKDKFNKLCSYIEDQFVDIRELIKP